MDTKQPQAQQGKAPKTRGQQGQGGSGRRGGRRPQREEREFDQQIIDVARVTRVTEGGKQMSFRATVAIGDRKSRVGMGIGKGLDVTTAITKAVNQAEKNMVTVPIVEPQTIPHEVNEKFGAAKVMMRPTRQGTGIIAGGVMRLILELSGIKNVTAKMTGSKNKVNNAKATIEGLRSLQSKAAREQYLGK